MERRKEGKNERKNERKKQPLKEIIIHLERRNSELTVKWSKYLVTQSQLNIPTALCRALPVRGNSKKFSIVTN